MVINGFSMTIQTGVLMKIFSRWQLAARRWHSADDITYVIKIAFVPTFCPPSASRSTRSM